MNIFIHGVKFFIFNKIKTQHFSDNAEKESHL